MYLIKKVKIWHDIRIKVYKLLDYTDRGYIISPLYYINNNKFVREDELPIHSLYPYKEIYQHLLNHKETEFHVWNQEKLEDFIKTQIEHNFEAFL